MSDTFTEPNSEQQWEIIKLGRRLDSGEIGEAEFHRAATEIWKDWPNRLSRPLKVQDFTPEQIKRAGLIK